ncbi:aminofutalosine synthase MqnE [Myxococcota bacterium]|nr:aminofutalosine synthase MqnE [Myxococcota bacterium]
MPARPPARPLSTATSRLLLDAGLGDLLERVEGGQRLSAQDGLRLFEAPLLAVGALANRVRERLHGDLCFFNRNLHVNATNVCEASCVFCSFARLKTGDAQAWTLSIDQAVARVRALSDVLVTEVHTVNGLNPDLPFDYYTDLLRALKAERPDLHLKGFTAVEIHYYAEKYGLSYEQVLRAFAQAGLESLPGGGAEIFAPRARKKLCDDKVDAEGWLEVHRVAHRLGLPTNCTLLFGSIETLEERVDHLLRLRALQDESLAARAQDPARGAFQTLIPLRFHNENNRLQRLRAPTARDCLRTIAVSRLLLDNVPHIKAYWPMLGLRVAQLAQHFGADDLDGTVREEHIYHMAGARTPQGLHRHELVRLVQHADRLPLERDTTYRVVRRDDPPAEPEASPATLPRLGAVGYTNTWPLVRFLGEPGPVQVRTGHPSQVAAWLAGGEVDLALLPVGALLTDPSLLVVPDVCIGCDGPVHSVLLVAETPPERWARVVLDGVSRTSVLLARLLLAEGPLRERVRPDLVVEDGAPGSGVERARGDVAAVVIGDVARDLPARLTTRLDLGALWKEWTGLPFVFAVWAGRPEVPAAVVDRVRRAGLLGLQRLDEAPEADRAYLRDAIRFPLDDAAMMGLRRFAALARRAGLVPHDGVSLYPPLPDRPAHPLAAAARRALDAAGQAPRSVDALSVDALHALLAAAPLSDLLAAAAARPRPPEATYRVAVRLPVSASAATTHDAVETLVADGGSRVDLVDSACRPDLAPWLEQARRLSRDGRVQVVVPDAAATLARLGQAEGVQPEEIATRLARAGVGAFELVLRPGEEAPWEADARGATRWEGLAAAGATLHLVLLHGAGADAADPLPVARALDRAAELARSGAPVTHVAVRSLGAERAAVPAADNTAVGWLRRVAVARLALPDTVRLVASPTTEGVGAVQVALQAGADDLGALYQGELQVEGALDFGEALVEVERNVEDAGRRPVRLQADGQVARAALAGAGRYRPLPTPPPAR